MNVGKLVLVALTGVAAGAVVGVLFAPEKGKDTRKKISKKSEAYLRTYKSKFHKAIDKLAGKFDSLKEEVSNFAGETRAKAHEMKN
jgi:gas vesicle protein